MPFMGFRSDPTCFLGRVGAGKGNMQCNASYTTFPNFNMNMTNMPRKHTNCGREVQNFDSLPFISPHTAHVGYKFRTEVSLCIAYINLIFI